MLFLRRKTVLRPRCSIPETGLTSTQMAGGTSVEYLTRRLVQAKRFDLLEAIERRQISTYHAAEIAGIVNRRPTLGLRDNAAKRLAYAARGLK